MLLRERIRKLLVALLLSVEGALHLALQLRVVVIVQKLLRAWPGTRLRLHHGANELREVRGPRDR